MTALLLTYHAIDGGAPPLSVDPDIFSAHLDCIEASGATVLTVSALTAALAAGRLPERAVVLTFDDGLASVVEAAAPLLADRGLPATVFCVAGRLGRDNRWPSQPSGALRSRLADAAELAELAQAGFEIGAHGWDHAPLHEADAAVARREVVDARRALEDAIGVEVSSFAYPYGALPSRAARALVEETYSAACTSRLDAVEAGTDPFALPRVDAHYVRRPEILRRALAGELRAYLWARSLGARARRVVAKDYAA